MQPPKKQGKPNRGGRPKGSRGTRIAAVEGLEDARRRKESALADLRQIEVRRKKLEYLEKSEVERAWSEVFRAVRAGVMAAPSRIRSRLPHLTTHDALVIDEELRAALSALADDTPLPATPEHVAE